MRRPLIIGVLAGALIAALVIGIVVANSDGDGDSARPRIAVGQQFADEVATLASSRYVELPAGRLALSVETVRTVPVLQGNGRELDPPSGGSVVQVRWAPAPTARTTAVFAARPTGRPTTIAIVVGSRRYPLRVDAAQSTASTNGGYARVGLPRGGTYLGVAGTASPSRIEVGYDGVTQSLDLRTGQRSTGPAAPLYTPHDSTPRCGDPVVVARPLVAERSAKSCTVSARRTAYVDGLGWAKAGRAWLIVASEILTPDVLHPRASFTPTVGLSDRGTIGYRYDGRAVHQVGVGFAPRAGFGRIEGVAQDVVAVSVPAEPGAARPFVITVRLTAKLLVGGGGREPITVTWSVPVA